MPKSSMQSALQETFPTKQVGGKTKRRKVKRQKSDSKSDRSKKGTLRGGDKDDEKDKETAKSKRISKKKTGSRKGSRVGSDTDRDKKDKLPPKKKKSKLENDSKERRPKFCSKKLEDQFWYHGMCTRNDIEPLLTKNGDFIVRSNERDGKVTVVVSLYGNGDRIHFIINESDSGGFYLLGIPKEHRREFSSVFDLIKHYKAHSIRLKDSEGTAVFYRLKEGVPRPRWLVNSELVSYDPNEKPLGSGHFANVYIGTFIYAGPKGKEKITVAIKVLKEKEGSSNEKEAKESMIREAKVMSFYSHPNVVQFYGLACDRPKEVILVMEYCRGGSLDSHLKAQKGSIVVAECVTFALEAALGMRYLHSEGCLHRDLAARNCLISDQGIVKISDFGLSTAEGVTEQTMTNMPLRWMAPETLIKKPQFSTKSDVWAFGVLLYEIFNEGEKPWPHEDVKLVAKYIRCVQMPPMPPRMPPPVREIVSVIWVKEVRLRPSFCSIVARLARIRIGELQPIDPAVSSMNRIQNVRRASYNYDYDELNDLEKPTGVTTEKTPGVGTTGGGSPPMEDDIMGCATKAMIRRPKLAIEGVEVGSPNDHDEPAAWLAAQSGPAGAVRSIPTTSGTDHSPPVNSPMTPSGSPTKNAAITLNAKMLSPGSQTPGPSECPLPTTPAHDAPLNGSRLPPADRPPSPNVERKPPSPNVERKPPSPSKLKKSPHK